MAVFKPSDQYIRNMLLDVHPSEHATARLVIDIAAILTGPTTGASAYKLAESLVDANGADAIAKALKEAAARYGAHRHSPGAPEKAPVYSIPGVATFTEKQYIIANDGVKLDRRVLALKSGESVTIDLGAKGRTKFWRIS